ncbi:hypothetical protein IJ750_02020 [bacterium]|nr:hypothetical protein [bacterium]
MKIQKISSYYSQPNILPQKNINSIYKMHKTCTDSVCFKGITTSLIVLVAKEGLEGLKSDIKKAKFKADIVEQITSPNIKNDAEKLVNVLFALSRTRGYDEPKTYTYSVEDDYEFGLDKIKMVAMRKLFPLIPEMKSDKNSGNAAKIAILNSAFDSAEYIYNTDFYHVFNNLTSFYEKEKEDLLKKAFHDKNIQVVINKHYIDKKAAKKTGLSIDDNEDLSFIRPAYNIFARPIINHRSKKYKSDCSREVYSSKIIADAALILTMNPQIHRNFFIQYEPDIRETLMLAGSEIKRRLTTNNGVEKANSFYDFYKNGFINFSNTNIYEQVLAYKYFMNDMKLLQNNVSDIAKTFLVDEKYAEDLIKDYKLLELSSSASDKKELIPLYKQRIEEKLKSEDENIRNSVAGLLYLSDNENIIKRDTDFLDNPKCKDIRELLGKINRYHSFKNKNYGLAIPCKPQGTDIKDELTLWEQMELLSG